jgi:hypothetical protein
LKLKKAAVVCMISAAVMSISPVCVYAEDSGVTRTEAGQYAFEMLQMFDYSSQVEMFDGDVDGTWYALYDYLAEEIYNDPTVYYDWYMAWLDGVDEYSDVYMPAVAESFTNTAKDKTAEQCVLRDKTAIITIKSFYDDTDEQFIKAYDTARKSGATSVIIDLRGNGGGVTDSAYNILNHIIPGEVPMYTVVEKQRTVIATSDGLGTWNPDLLILTDKNTASAAEIVTAVLGYNGYARVIGEQTFGKGIGEYYIRLTIGDYLSVTAQRYFLPNGTTWHGTGITPDILITDDVKTAADEVLEHAITLADGKGNMQNQDEQATFSVTVNLISDERLESFATFTAVKRFGYAKPVRYSFVSENGMRMIVDAQKAFEAAHDGYYFGIYNAQSKAAEQILKNNSELKIPANAVVLVTVQPENEDFGFSPTIAIDTETQANYFYYYNSAKNTFTEFLPGHDYENGILRFTIKKGGIIIASDTKI